MESKPRIKSLDSLRGIAAAAVVIGHLLPIFLKGHTLDEYTPLYLFRAAHEAVIFFFILSGYVLTYQIQNQNYFNYKNFITQRFFRIYVPYFTVMVLTIILFLLVHENHGNSTIKTAVWSRSVSFNAIINHIILIGNFNTNDYNPVIWTLVHEMRVSIIFPILLFVISFKWQKALIIAITLSIAAAFAITYELEPANGFDNSYLFTIHYFSLFVLGGLIVKNSLKLTQWYQHLGNRTKLFMLITALLIFTYSRMIYLIPHYLKLTKISIFNEFISDWITAIAACFIIVMTLQIVNVKNILLHGFFLMLGRISYSLYLVHVPMMMVFFVIFANINKIVIAIICTLSSVILSFIINRFVEKPSARLGKYIGAPTKNKL